ncbi:MAG: hypothetical protein HKN47_24120, partial [Pirellulaceae bacterium]|nr:hypothetical protein [Pirellulaceae bacterium]
MFRTCFLCWLTVSLFAGWGSLDIPALAETPAVAPGAISPETPSDASAPLLVGITVHHRDVTTQSVLAQRYFDQGLNLSFAFNHDEAIRSFREAARLDPKCAMAWWGVAICSGPHINNAEMDKPNSVIAWEALQKAQDLQKFASPIERSLIDALALRYIDNADENIAQREQLDKRYCVAMERVHEQFPDDLDVAVWYAESMMNLRPWDLWSDDGNPRPGTPRILEVLENVMARQPTHPGANHLFIHAVE